MYFNKINLLFIVAFVAMFSCQVNANQYGKLQATLNGKTLSTDLFMNSKKQLFISPNSKHIIGLFVIFDNISICILGGCVDLFPIAICVNYKHAGLCSNPTVRQYCCLTCQ